VIKTIALAFAGALIASTTVQAGDNSILGVVSVGPNNRSTITDAANNYTRWFVSNSSDGQKILHESPNGSTCQVEMALPTPTTLTVCSIRQ
jgi:hypothetical protein